MITKPPVCEKCVPHPAHLPHPCDEGCGCGHTDEKPDMVDHPKHYNSLPAKCRNCGEQIECIDVIEHMTLNLGNSVKYVWRGGHKGDLIEDLKKARWYLEREIERIKKEHQNV